MQAAAAVGFFGKLPCRGDFLKRRVREDFLAIWDEWLQQCLAESRRQLQDEWLGAYLASPVWRFVLSEGVCGTGMYAGVLVPSVDRVGRYFPMTLIAQWDSEHGALDVACNARAWFDSMEALALEVPDTSDPDVFDAKVARLGGVDDAAAAAESAYLRDALAHAAFPNGTAEWHLPLQSVHSLQRAVNTLALREIERAMRPLSLWWTDGSEAVDASWLCVRGLPAPERFAAMLSGHWSGAGWQSLAPRMPPAARPATHESTPMPASAPIYRIVASHEAVAREWGTAPPRTHFVERPELGLWGIAASSADEPDPYAVQAIADALYGVEDGGSLTVLAEHVRQVLSAVERQLGRERYEDTGVMIFVARGPDCALVFSGCAQATRRRGTQAVTVVYIAVVEQEEAAAGSVSEPVNENIALMDLVTRRPEERAAPRTGPRIGVRYEFLSPGDAWVLEGAAARLLLEIKEE